MSPSCAVVQKQLTTKGWQAVAAASQSYHCVSSQPSTSVSGMKLTNGLMTVSRPGLIFNSSIAYRNFSGK